MENMPSAPKQKEFGTLPDANSMIMQRAGEKVSLPRYRAPHIVSEVNISQRPYYDAMSAHSLPKRMQCMSGPEELDFVPCKISPFDNFLEILNPEPVCLHFLPLTLVFVQRSQSKVLDFENIPK